MSRISQTRSLLSNLSSFSLGSEPEDEKVETITEHFLPRRQDAVFGDQFVFQATTLRPCISAKLVLLAPLACDVPPFAKSVIYLSSPTGSINATVQRQPDVQTHTFCLYVFARGADVKVTLPALFRGVINLKTNDGVYKKGQARYCRAFRERVRCEQIRFDSCTREDEDEVYIHAEGRIEIRLMPLTENDGGESMGSRVCRHVRRIFTAR